MAKGADWTVEWRFSAEDLRVGAEHQIMDEWRFACEACESKGVARNRSCDVCGGQGFVWRTCRKAEVLKIPAGSKPGRKIRVRGWGYHGDPDTPENRGDRIITLLLYGDGEIRDELPPSRAPEQRVQNLPPARGPSNRLSGGK